jgi:hypothetical protein
MPPVTTALPRTERPEVEPHESTPAEWDVLIDRQARRCLGMSGPDFVRAWRAGAFDDNTDRPEIMRVAMLLPPDLGR